MNAPQKQLCNRILISLFALFAFCRQSPRLLADTSSLIGIKVLEGEVLKQLFIGEDIKYSLTGTFTLSQGDNRFMMSMYDPSESGSTLFEFLISDFSSIYQSQTVATNGVPPKVAFAAFSAGDMPNALISWGVPGMLVLAYHLTTNSPSVVSNGSLRPAAVPEFAARRAAQEGKSLYTRVVPPTSDGHEGVEFWATDESRAPATFEDDAHRFLLGKLTIDAISEGFPVHISYVNNIPMREPNGRLHAQRHSTFSYTASVQSMQVPSHYFNHIAYHDNVQALVNDDRFGGRFGYRLEPGNEPSFKGTPGYDTLVAHAKLRFAKSTSAEEKRGLTIGIIAFLPFAIWTIYKWNRKQ